MSLIKNTTICGLIIIKKKWLKSMSHEKKYASCGSELVWMCQPVGCERDPKNVLYKLGSRECVLPSFSAAVDAEQNVVM